MIGWTIVRVVFELKNTGTGLLSVENGYYLGSVIYNVIDSAFDKETSKKLHDYGLKDWSISNIRVKNEYREYYEEGIIKIRENSDRADAYFYLSTLNDEFARKLIMNFPAIISVPATDFVVTNIKILESEKIRMLKTITPALFYNRASGHFYTIEELDSILNIIREKVKYFGGDADGFKLKSIEEVVVRFKGKTVPGFYMTLKVKDSKTGEILYNTGVGHKTTLGYGFVKAISR